MYLVMDKMEISLSKIISNKIILSGALIVSYVYQILCGLQYMHAANIIHRDIVSKSIYLKKKKLCCVCCVYCT